MPVDTLSSSPAREVSEKESPGRREVLSQRPRKLSPVRYRKKRDPKVVAELDQMGSEMFSLDEEPKRESKEDVGNLLKRRRRDTRELLIGDGSGAKTIRNGYDSIRYTVLGSVSLLDINQSEVEIEHTIMNFTNVGSEFRPIVKFHSRDDRVEEFQLDLIHNCKKIWFTQNMKTVGFLLNKEINVSVTSMGMSISAKCIVWMSNRYLDVKPNRLGQIKEILDFLTENKLILGSAVKVIKNLSELEFRRCIKSQVRQETEISKSTNYSSGRLKNFDKNLSSLQILKKFNKKKTESSSSTIKQGTIHGHRTAKPILIHREKPEISSKEDDHSRNSNDKANKIDSIPSKGFYARPEGVPKTDQENKLSDHLLSNIRKTRNSSTKPQENTALNIDDDEDDKDYETPKIFKPSLHYKFPDGSSYTITNQDFRCLYNKDWINDSIIDFFTKFFIEASIEQKKVERDQVYLMSSFFYTKLISSEKDVYQNVKKWVQNSDLFSKKYVVIPINMNYHWFGCIITNLEIFLKYHKELKNDNPKKETSSKEEADEDVSISSPIITILTFDSLKQTHSKEIDPIKEFLVSYAKDKYNVEIEKSYVKMKTCTVPQQPNFSDCGIHLILNTKKFFESPKETLDLWYSSKVKSRANMKNINLYFDKVERGMARKNLREILLLLQEEQIRLSDGKLQDENELESNNDDDEEIEIIEDFTEKLENKDNEYQDDDRTRSAGHWIKKFSSIKSDPPSEDPSYNEELNNVKSNCIAAGLRSEKAAKDSMNENDREKNNDDTVNYNFNKTPEKEETNVSKGFTSPYFGKSILKARKKNYSDLSGEQDNDSFTASGKSTIANDTSENILLPTSLSEPDENDEYSEKYNDSDVSLIRDHSIPMSVTNRTDSFEGLRSNLDRELQEEFRDFNE